ETYSVTVPKTYSPDRPAGLLIWVSSSPRGDCPNMYKPLLAQRNLIWVGANNSGNPEPVFKRFGLAVDAVENMKKLYKIDPGRVFVSGVSGGGRCASMLTVGWPEVFTGGGMYVVGCNFFGPLDVKDDGTYLPGFWGKPPTAFQQKLLHQAKQHYFVFLTGETDYNREGTLKAYKAYLEAGVPNCEYIEVPGMGHVLPPPDWFDKSLAYLDKPLLARADRLYRTAQSQYRSGKSREALRNYALAESYGSEKAARAMVRIREQIKEVTQQGEEQIKAMDYYRAYRTLNKLVQNFGDLAPEAEAYIERFKTAPIASSEIKAGILLDRAGALHQKGRKEESRKLLQKIVAEHPETQAAVKADEVLQK
ncbi:MAG: hypothetical protein AAF492_22175, partial [Verrucomicrobiota bacterium]